MINRKRSETAMDSALRIWEELFQEQDSVARRQAFEALANLTESLLTKKALLKSKRLCFDLYHLLLNLPSSGHRNVALQKIKELDKIITELAE